jgi:hypothetical protein
MEQLSITFYDPYDIWYHPFWSEKWFLWVKILLGFFIGLALLFSLYFLYRRFKKQITPWNRAFFALNTIIITEHMSDLDAKKWYSLITNVLKTYLYERYGYVLEGKTDTEVIDYLKAQHFESKVIDLYTVIVDAAIRYKFADQRARTSDMKVALTYATEIIKITKPT